MDISTGKVPIYVGVGGRFKVKNNKNNTDEWMGVRVPFGIVYMFAGPVDIFLEIVPVLDLTPKTDVSINGGLGFRYFFK
jgi:hypothetical protein